MLEQMRGWIFLALVFLCACSGNDTKVEPVQENELVVKGVDISRLPQIEKEGTQFFNASNVAQNFLSILKENGVNTIRLKLWVDPIDGNSGMAEVNEFSTRLRSLGFKLWLTVHYSDTWADPGKQILPKRWKSLSYVQLKDSVASYTQRVVRKLKPDFIQIGNEVNSGFLHPHGKMQDNKQQFIELLKIGSRSVREINKNAKIMIHFAGVKNANWFFEQIKEVDYDIIGLSYYPIWHGKAIDGLAGDLNDLSERYQKEIIIAETAYPFTLGWNDWTNNIVGSEKDLILPDYTATPEGQKKFIERIKQIITTDVNRGIGFCYWGAELVAWRGKEAKDGSPWENQALFDFDFKALPVMEAFND
ncbi:arabinogalactan endo-1,4-beta-galactosidase [Prolixibacteraceae bacterium JC049]|nr:arabinogalactan endo-1,4-beta-galactosidase [Prolixibacteraceae bacterium JC049]